MQNPNPTPNDGFAEGTSILTGEWKLIFTSALDVLSLGLIPGVQIGQIFQNINEDGSEVRVKKLFSSRFPADSIVHVSIAGVRRESCAGNVVGRTAVEVLVFVWYLKGAARGPQNCSAAVMAVHHLSASQHRGLLVSPPVVVLLLCNLAGAEYCGWSRAREALMRPNKTEEVTIFPEGHSY